MNFRASGLRHAAQGSSGLSGRLETLSTAARKQGALHLHTLAGGAGSPYVPPGAPCALNWAPCPPPCGPPFLPHMIPPPHPPKRHFHPRPPPPPTYTPPLLPTPPPPP